MSCQATFRYGVPDPTQTANDLCLYAFAACKVIKDERQLLRDVRSATDLATGSAGLDAQGFTFVKHTSSLSGEEWFQDGKVEDVYIQEVLALVRDVTGASRAVVDGVAFRRKLANEQNNPYHVLKRGGELDLAISELPRDRLRVTGMTESASAEPARMCHIDYTVEGIRNTIRWCRQDLHDAGKNIIEAEDRLAKGEDVQVPRFAAFSVWRPLEVVKRDPLAVLDWRSVDQSEILHSQQRALSALSENGEYLRNYSIALPPKNPESHRWYWMPEQSPDDVLIFKFADSAANQSNGIAAGCVHCSPAIDGSDGTPVRSSVECRVIAFWD